MPRTSEVLPKAEEIWNLNDEVPVRPAKTGDKTGDKAGDKAAEKATGKPTDKSAKAEPDKTGERGDDDKSPSIAPKT